jgi:tubulin polyglutamylase TTLL6/13
MCFEILGYDIFIDSEANPHLIEVNHLPSFNSDTEIDRNIKNDMLYDALKLLNVTRLNKVKKKIELR